MALLAALGPRRHAGDEAVALPNLHFVRVAVPAGMIDGSVVVRMLANAFREGLAVLIVKDDPIRRHRARTMQIGTWPATTYNSRASDG